MKQREPIHYGRSTLVLEQPELYDLKADISEKHDLAETFPEILSDFLDKMDLHLMDVADSIPDQLADRIQQK
ncbi:MAG: hypothetical protein O2806_07095 [Bacteroidetes bacterium]|nr:hypothetical protein [Bacteroidota bacterium]